MTKSKTLLHGYVTNIGSEDETVYLDAYEGYDVTNAFAILDLIVSDLLQEGISMEEIVKYVENTTESDVLS